MCLQPFIKKDQQQVPCGRCAKCTSRRVSAWSFRLMQEDKRSTSSLFITLTYANEHVPISPKGYMSLSETIYQDRIAKRGKNKGLLIKAQLDSHLQSFFKRLRKAQFGNAGGNIRYYAAGEYGGKTNRPHYHAIIFNARIELIQDAWQYGSVHYGDVNEASVGYTLKYISKPSRIPMHANDDRVPEYAMMSKRLGDNYLTPQMIAWHKADMYNRMYCNLKDGKKITMPRYYKDKVYEEHERIQVGHYSRQQMLEREASFMELMKLTPYDYDEYKRRQLIAAAEKQRSAAMQTSKNRI